MFLYFLRLDGGVGGGFWAGGWWWDVKLVMHAR
jgi:hypothetical protein